MAVKSANQMSAKIELEKKMEQLQKGKLPEEYKSVVYKEKKFTSKKAFIENEQLRKEYENRSNLSKL